MSLEQTEAECAANAKAPRVSLSDIEAAIDARYNFTGEQAIQAVRPPPHPPILTSLRLLSICLLVMKNGFTVVGKSAPASPENFNAELGKKLAYEDAIRQLWPLCGYALCEKLAAAPIVIPKDAFTPEQLASLKIPGKVVYVERD